MADEYGSRSNPIRFNKPGYQGRAKTVFENQVHGTYVQEYTGYGQNPTSQMFYCTKYMTQLDEPVWCMMNMQLDGTPIQTEFYYVLVRQKKNGALLETRNTILDKNITLDKTVAKAQKRHRYGMLGNPKQYGEYVFVGLSQKEIELITGASSTATTSQANKSNITNFLNSSIIDTETAGAIYSAGQKRLLDVYDYVSADTGKRAGPGKSKLPTFNVSEFDLNESVVAPVTTSKTNTALINKKKNPSTTDLSTSRNPRSTELVKVKLDSSIYQNSSKSTATLNTETRPYMEQRYFVYELNGTRTEVVRRHTFELIPNSFEFSQMSSTWNEVERSGNYPLVDWSKYNLTKVSFRFLVSGTRVDTVTNDKETINTLLNDGLDVSVDEKIENLRAMGGAPAKIRIYNMNTLLTDSYRYPYINKAGSIEWVIADMSISVNRQTTSGKNIAAAEVSITLNEYPVVGTNIIMLPPLEPSDPSKKPQKPKNTRPTGNGKFTPSLDYRPDSSVIIHAEPATDKPAS